MKKLVVILLVVATACVPPKTQVIPPKCVSAYVGPISCSIHIETTYGACVRYGAVDYWKRPERCIVAISTGTVNGLPHTAYLIEPLWQALPFDKVLGPPWKS